MNVDAKSSKRTHDQVSPSVSSHDSQPRKTPRKATAPYPATSEEHAQMDKIVFQSMTPFKYSAFPFEAIATFLLVTIVTYSPKLDQSYGGLRPAAALIDKHEWLRKELQEAWVEEKFARIRNLEILQGTPSPVTTTANMGRAGNKSSMASAFHHTTYFPDALTAFKQYLIANSIRFQKGQPATSRPYYGKYCSIVQSSGTGKSRLIAELGKSGVCVVYMNLRDQTDTSSYPPRDNIPAGLLDAGDAPTAKHYEARCSAFFTALFTAVRQELHDIRSKCESWEEISVEWQNRYGPPQYEQRRRLFSSAKREFDLAMTIPALQNLEPTPPPSHTTEKSPSQQDSDASESSTKFQEPLFIGRGTMVEAYQQLIQAFPEALAGPVHEPRVVLGIDEASCLRKQSHHLYIPAHILCTAISLFSKITHSPIWVVFASTESRVADFAAPNKIHNSLRLIEGGEMLFRPFTELGFDQLAPRLDEISLDRVDTVEHISGFGRPLWSASLKYLLNDPVRMAQAKLLKAEHFANTLDQALAVLSQRFALDVLFGHPQAIEHVETGVASHLRICTTMTEDRSWRFTSYPSEPLLSHAAAQIMWEQPEYIGQLLSSLKTKLESGMIERGKNGELVCRLLLLLAKDICTKEKVVPKPNQLLYCSSVSVAEWLEVLFGDKAWPEDAKQREASQKAFKHARINFSHWISMSSSIVPIKKDEIDMEREEGTKRMESEEWTKRHYVRTSAVQCVHEQHLIDQVIPVYFTDTDGNRSTMSHICVSDKLRIDATPTDVSKISRSDASILLENNRPWIAITLDLGVSTNFNATYHTRGKNKCLRIYAAGTTHETFPFLSNNNLEGAIMGIRDRTAQPLLDQVPLAAMRDRMQVGTTTQNKHMRWEPVENAGGS